jgi:D-glutamate N-acetyltransferase
VKLALFTDGLFETPNAKTAHGILRYGTREVVAVVDSKYAGRLANEVVPYARRPVPIVASIAEAREADTLVIGVAPMGGALTPEWRAALLEAVGLGMSIEAGLHTVLADDPAFAGANVRDLRAAPPGLTVPTGERPDVRVVHTVGSDCAIGKMSVTLELDALARARGLKSAFVATGQTGIAISGWGIAVDHVISDFVNGAAWQLVQEGAARGAELLFVEGQGALGHPAYSGVTLGLLHGCMPDALILCHRAGSTHNDDYPWLPIPPLPELVTRAEEAAAWVRPARVVAIALNTRGLSDGEAQAAINAAAQATGLPAGDPVRFSGDALLDAAIRP